MDENQDKETVFPREICYNGENTKEEKANMGFDFIFSFVHVMFPMIFLLVFAILLVTIIRGPRTWNRNNKSPVCRWRPDGVLRKRTGVWIAGGGDTGRRSFQGTRCLGFECVA